MKQQSKKYLLLILLVAVFVAPSIALAAWYNPFSWNWDIFSWFQKQTPIVQTPVTKTPTACPMYCLQNMICGANGKDYCNECLLKAAGTTVAHQGRCTPTITTTCTPNWQCDWGTCINGYQSETAIDSNNCGLPSSGARIACPALARICNTVTQ